MSHADHNPSTMLSDSLPVVAVRGGGGGRVPTMTSREIAELANKRHDNVRRTIESLAKQGVIELPQFEGVKNHLGQTVGEYVFSGEGGKRDSIVVIAQLSPEFTARLVDRWRQLETALRSGGASARRDPRIAEIRESRLTMNQNLRLGRMAGLTGNQLLLSANRATVALTGVDRLHLMGVTHMDAPQNEALLTPTDIGRRLGGVSAREVNRWLCRRGLQNVFRDGKDGLKYEPTESGRAAGGVMQDTGKRRSNGTPVRQLKWASSILRLFESEGQSEMGLI